MPQTNKRKFKDPLVLTLITAVILTGLAIYSVYTHRPPSVKPVDIIPKPTQIKIITPTALFSTAVFLNRNKTFVSLPYKLGQPPQTVWLTLQTPANTPEIIRLVYHPTLAAIKWPYLEDNGLRLYQKQKTYASVSDFLKNPPSRQTTLADPHLLKIPAYQRLKAKPLPDDPAEINLDQVDYIFTTYTDSRQDQSFSYYETTLDATSAFVSNENKLNWQLSIASVSADHPMYLGDIHVDYRQY